MPNKRKYGMNNTTFMNRLNGLKKLSGRKELDNAKLNLLAKVSLPGRRKSINDIRPSGDTRGKANQYARYMARHGIIANPARTAKKMPSTHTLDKSSRHVTD